MPRSKKTLPSRNSPTAFLPNVRHTQDDLVGLRELDCVADEIDEGSAQPPRVTDEMFRNVLCNLTRAPKFSRSRTF